MDGRRQPGAGGRGGVGAGAAAPGGGVAGGVGGTQFGSAPGSTEWVVGMK